MIGSRWAIAIFLALSGCDAKQDSQPSFSDKSFSGIHECDLLAADPLDPSRPASTGISHDKIDPDKAIDVCIKAAYEYGKTVRFRYQTARALVRADRGYDAVEWMAGAAAEEYAPAYKGLADLYLGFATTTFDRVEDLQIAYALTDAASNAGYPVTDEEIYQISQQLYSIWFTDDGYSKPDLFKGIYEGNFSLSEAGDKAAIEESIVQTYFTRVAYCKDEENEPTLTIDQILLPFIKVASTRAEKTGYNKQNQFIIAMGILSGMQKWISDNIDSPDMVLFMARHGCTSPVSQTFSKNIQKYVSEISLSAKRTDYYKIIEPQIIMMQKFINRYQ